MRFLPLLPFASLILSACSDPAELPAAPKGVVPLYGNPAETILSPYPSDRYTVADASTPTGLRVQIGKENTSEPFLALNQGSVDQLNEMDGFSTMGGVFVNFSGPIDARTIAVNPTYDPPYEGPVLDALDYERPGAPFHLVDIDPDSPERGKAVGLLPRWYPQPADDFYQADFTLLAEPARPLRPATRYLFVVTNAVKAEDSGPVTRSPDMEALLSGGAEGVYGEEVRAGLAEVSASGLVREEDVVLATAFTTAAVRAGIEGLSANAREAPAPALLSNFEVETPAEPGGRVRFRAVYEAPEYRGADGKWSFSEGRPVAQEKVGLEVFLSFSKAEAKGKRPVVIYGHGLGGDKDGTWGTSARLAEIHASGAAVFGIDSPEHGTRAKDPNQDSLGSASAFFGIDLSTGAFDIGVARDNFRQMASDQLELVRLIDALGSLDLLPVGAPDGEPDLDTSRILYIGHSFGSVQGPTIMALAPEIRQAVWNVGGDGLMMLIRDSNVLSLFVNGLKPPRTPDGALARFLATTQAIVDPGDPINYARFADGETLASAPPSTPRDVLLQVVMNDSIVPNSSSEALARATGMTLMNPIRDVRGLPSAEGPLTGNGASGSTLVMSQFDRIEGKVAQHGELIFSPEGQGQYVEFFRTGLVAPNGTANPAY